MNNMTACKIAVFLTEIKESRAQDISYKSFVNAAVVVTAPDGSQIDIKIAENIQFAALMTRVQGLSSHLSLGNFNIGKASEPIGTGTISIEGLLYGGNCRAVAIAQIKRINEENSVGFVLCSRDGKAGQLTREKTYEYIRKHGKDSVQNLKIVTNNSVASYVASKDSSRMPAYIIGAAEKRKADKTVVNNKSDRVKKDIDKKNAVLKKLSGTKIGQHLSADYDFDAIMYLVYLAKKKRRYDYLLNPQYTKAQMFVLNAGYRDGYDISVYSDPKISDIEMLNRLNLMRHNAWVDVGTSKL